MSTDIKAPIEAHEAAVQKVMALHAERLEIFAAAFLKEVGSAEATKYVLVQQHDPITQTMRFWFERKENLPND